MSMLLVFACTSLLSCGIGSPNEEEAETIIMDSYDCEKDPVLEDSYKEDDGTYTFNYTVRHYSLDGYLIFQVPVAVNFYKDSGEWIYNYMNETGSEEVCLNPEVLIGTWTGSGYVPTGSSILADRGVLEVNFEITSVSGSEISYNLGVTAPDDIKGDLNYESSGTIDAEFERGDDGAVSIETNTPLITQKYSSLIDEMTTEYCFTIYSNEENAEYSSVLLRGGGELYGDIKLSKE
ncbi:MAG: hypothetical protein Q4C80_07570 [Bacillota bacterium]|nr:hypothetical protein [Bacillota bacterium]